MAPLIRRLTTLLIAGSLAMITTVIAFEVAREHKQDQLVGSTDLVRLAREAYALTLDRETAIRGFLLTRDRIFLAPDKAADRTLAPQLDSIARLSAPDPSLARLSSRVRPDIGQWDHHFATPATAGQPIDFETEVSSEILFDKVRQDFTLLVAQAQEKLERQTTTLFLVNRAFAAVLLAEILALAAAVVYSSRSRLINQAKDVVRHRSLLDAALASAPVGFAFFSTDLRFVRTNRFLEEMWDKPSMRIGKTPEEALPAIGAVLRAQLERVRDTRQVIRDVSFNADSESERKRFLSSFYPIATPGGEMLGLGAAIVDVTERSLAEEAMRESEERYRLVSRATSDAVCDWHLLTGKLIWNESAQDMMGILDTETVVDESWWASRIDPAQYGEVRSSFISALKSPGEDVWSCDFRICTRAHLYANVEASVFILRNDLGRAIRIIGAMVDKTSEMEMQSQLRQGQKMEAVGRLAGGIAHDFNNMLTVIRAYSEILVSDIPATEPNHADAREIVKAADKAAALVGQLLMFSRQQVSHPEVLDVNSLLRGTEVMMRHIIPSNVRVVVEVETHPANVRADASQLEQLLLNLAINASDAMSAGGCLTLSAVRCELEKSLSTPLSVIHPGSYICVGVRDTGIGMDAETISRAFDPFFTTKPPGKGTGLGLATVHGIVGQSGGHVVVFSEPGKGSEFRIYLPRISSEG